MKNYLKKNKVNIITFVIMLVFSMIMCNDFIRMHYTVDTYRIADLGYEYYAKNWFLKDGRIFTYLFMIICSKLKFSITSVNYISTILSLIISCISVITIKNMILKIRPAKTKLEYFLICMISYLMIFNFMYIETLYFIETCILSLSVLLYILAAKNIVFGEKKYFFSSVILAILGIICYQGTIGFFMVVAVSMLIIKYKKPSKELFKKIVLVFVCTAISVLVDMIVVNLICKILNTSQTRTSLNRIPKNIAYVWHNAKYILIDSCGMIGKYIFIGSLIILEVLIIGYSIEKKEYIHILTSLIIIVSSIILSFAMFAGTLSSFDHSRLYVGLGALAMIVSTYIYCDTDILQDKNLYKYVLIIFVIASFLFNTINYLMKINEVQIVNKLEKEYSQTIANYLKANYPNTTEAMVICIEHNEDEIYFKELKNRDNFTINEIKGFGGAVSGLNINTGMHLKQIQNEEILQKYKEFYNKYKNQKNYDNTEEATNQNNVEMKNEESKNNIEFIDGTYSAVIDNVLIMPAFIW